MIYMYTKASVCNILLTGRISQKVLLEEIDLQGNDERKHLIAATFCFQGREVGAADRRPTSRAMTHANASLLQHFVFRAEKLEVLIQ